MPASVGFLYPGHSAEDDYPIAQRLLGGSPELRVVHTAMPEDAHRVDALLEIGADDVLAAGARTLTDSGEPGGAPAIASLVWACTSGSFVFGWEGAAAQVAALRAVAGVPTSSTSFAFVDAARQLGLGQVAMAATYPPDVARRFVSFLAVAGITVARLATLDIVTAAEVATLSAERVFEIAAAVAGPDVDAVLLPDTALHTVGLVDELERRLSMPVLTANQVSIWQGLRLAGDRTPRLGLGLLFTT